MHVKDELVNTYNREIKSKPYNRLMIFTVFLVFNIIVFGVFGIFLGYRSFSEKLAQKNQYLEVKKNLEANIEEVDYLDLELKSPQVKSYLDSAVGIGNGLSLYLPEIVNAAAINGFSISQLNVGRNSDDGVISLIILFNGDSNAKVGELVGTIEKLDRLTNVKNVSVAKSESDVLLKVELEIYYVENE